jgi:chemotaxis protein histidine kinase CheA
LQIVSDCLLSLEANHSPEEINKLFRAIHTVKGSAAQVGLKRLGAIAHRVEDLIGRLREGELEPLPQVIDLCLESVDVLKKTLHKQWADEAEMRTGVDSLLNRIAEVAPMDEEEEVVASGNCNQEFNPSQAKSTAPNTSPKNNKVSTAAARQVSRISLSRLDRMMEHRGRVGDQPRTHAWAV